MNILQDKLLDYQDFSHIAHTRSGPISYLFEDFAQNTGGEGGTPTQSVSTLAAGNLLIRRSPADLSRIYKQANRATIYLSAFPSL